MDYTNNQNILSTFTNQKIKVLKSQIYGFRNKEYFTLRLYALHDRSLRIQQKKQINSSNELWFNFQ